MFFKVDQRQRSYEEIFNKAVDYQQVSVNNRISKMDYHLENKIKTLDEKITTYKQ